MFQIYEQLKPALKQWRKDQYDLEMLAEPWYLAKCVSGNAASPGAGNPTIDLLAPTTTRRLTRSGRTDAKANPDSSPANPVGRISAVHCPGSVRTGKNREPSPNPSAGASTPCSSQSDAATEKWCELCDVLGRLGPLAHQKSLPELNQWIAEEPRLWQLYLARGVANLYAAQHKGDSTI